MAGARCGCSSRAPHSEAELTPASPGASARVQRAFAMMPPSAPSDGCPRRGPASGCLDPLPLAPAGRRGRLHVATVPGTGGDVSQESHPAGGVVSQESDPAGGGVEVPFLGSSPGRWSPALVLLCPGRPFAHARRHSSPSLPSLPWPDRPPGRSALRAFRPCGIHLRWYPVTDNLRAKSFEALSNQAVTVMPCGPARAFRRNM